MAGDGEMRRGAVSLNLSGVGVVIKLEEDTYPRTRTTVVPTSSSFKSPVLADASV